MTPEANAIHQAITEMEKLDETVAAELLSKVEKQISCMSAIFRETLLSNDKAFKQLFLSSFNDKEKFAIVADHLAIHVSSIQIAYERDEVIRFASYTMTCERLAEMYKTVKAGCGMDKLSFIMGWFMLNDSDAFRKIFLDKNLDVEQLTEKARKFYMKNKARKDEAAEGK